MRPRGPLPGGDDKSSGRAPLTRVTIDSAPGPRRRRLHDEEEAPLALPPEAPHGLVFEQVFAEHAAFMWRAAAQARRPEADVEDVCQEAFLVVHRRLPTYEGRSSLRTWLYGIRLRTASDYRRRPHRSREETHASPPDTILPAPQDAEMERHHALSLLDEALAELDDEKRDVFVLYEVEQLSMAEIAAAVGCPLQTAYSRLHAARRLLMASIERMQNERRTPCP